MAKVEFPPDADAERFTWRINELRQALTSRDPHSLARLTGAYFDPSPDETAGVFSLMLWDREVRLSFTEFVASEAKTGQELILIHQALLLYYFNTADGSPLDRRWIAFSELPDGRFYTQAFQSYTGLPLAQAFGSDLERFKAAARRINGLPLQPSGDTVLGDAAYIFQALPRVILAVVYWLGDEDFPSSCQVLFDASASRYLPTDAYAILGSTLTRRLIAAS